MQLQTLLPDEDLSVRKIQVPKDSLKGWVPMNYSLDTVQNFT